jgi:hypothetical protein
LSILLRPSYPTIADPLDPPVETAVTDPLVAMLMR